jgi:hypothetical protein
MITAYASLHLPGQPPKSLGAFTGVSARSIVFQVLERWPLLPPACLYLDGQPIPLPKAPGFLDAGTRAKAADRLRDPEVQRRKVAARLATEAARRAREAAMTPEERAALTRQRSDRHKARWRKYWQDKADRRRA